MELIVNLGPDTYPIYIENGILPQTGSYIRKFFTGKKIMLISDDHVFPLYGKTVLDSLKDYECHSLVLPHGEPTKSFQTLHRFILRCWMPDLPEATWSLHWEEA